eukprot:5560318-Amphidinium_carterae.1
MASKWKRREARARPNMRLPSFCIRTNYYSRHTSHAKPCRAMPVVPIVAWDVSPSCVAHALVPRSMGVPLPTFGATLVGAQQGRGRRKNSQPKCAG